MASPDRHLDPVADLIAEAKRVLPGGSFGNMPAEVVIRAGKARRPRLGRGRQASMSISCWAPARCSSAMPIPR